MSVQGVPGSDAAALRAVAERHGPQITRQLAILWQAREADLVQRAAKAAKAQARRSRREPDPWRAERAMPISLRMRIAEIRMRPVFPPRGA